MPPSNSGAGVRPEIEGEERQDEQDLDGNGEGEARHPAAERRLVLRGARAVVGRIQGVGSLMSVLREKGAGPSTHRLFGQWSPSPSKLREELRSLIQE